MEIHKGESQEEILLLQPWVEDFYATDCRSLPIGLAYLAGSIKKSLPGSKVFIYDFFSPRKRRTISLPKEFQYLKRYYGTIEKSPSALFHNYFRFGLHEDEILKRLDGHSPKLIGISSLFSPYYRESLALAAICKKQFPSTPVVMGGNHASLSPETLLFHKNEDSVSGYCCDYVIRGEGEESIVALICALKYNNTETLQPNIVERSNAKSTKSIPLKPLTREKIPLPDYCNIDLTEYTYGGKPMSFLITSRSCPHHCSFCSIHAVFGNNYTARANEDIITEIRHFYAKGVRHFNIEDDNFTYIESKCADLLDSIARLNLANVSFSAMNGVSYHTLTPRLLQKMKTAGFSDLNLSLVSSQQHLRKKSNRPERGEHLDTVLDAADLLGFHTVVYFIIGLPEQSLEDAVETLSYLAKRKCLIGPSPFYLTPNSPIDLQYPQSSNLIRASTGNDPHFSARLTALDVEKPGFSRDELYTVFRLARVINHLKKLLDEGQKPDQKLFKEAVTALSLGKWQTIATEGNRPPFAKSVRALMLKHLTSISGYKSSNRCEINLQNRFY